MRAKRERGARQDGIVGAGEVCWRVRGAEEEVLPDFPNRALDVGNVKRRQRGNVASGRERNAT